MHPHSFGINRIVVALALVGLLTLQTDFILLATVPVQAETEVPSEPFPGAEDPALTHGSNPWLNRSKQTPTRPKAVEKDTLTKGATRFETKHILPPPVHILYCVRRE